MYRSSLLNQILVTLLVSMSFGLVENRSMQTGVTSKATNICARNTACKYAICLRNTRDRNTCTLVPLLLNSNCICPPTQVCSLNNELLESESPLLYHYRCRNPSRVHGVHHV